MPAIRFEVREANRRLVTAGRRLRQRASTLPGRRVLAPALQDATKPGEDFLKRNTPRSRDIPRGRIRLANSVRSVSGSLAGNNYTYVRTGWRTGRTTGISRAQTLAVEHSTRYTRGTRVTRRAFLHALRSNPGRSIGNAVQNDLNRALRD